jgi:membrane protease YdiL (CAAX protease family)
MGYVWPRPHRDVDWAGRSVDCADLVARTFAGTAPDVADNGIAVILSICISTPVQVLLLILFARSRTGSATDYLGLTLPRRSEVVIGLLIILIFLAAIEGITWLVGRDIVSQGQLEVYRTARTAGYLPWLWLMLVLMAPVGEEILFRGFLFRGSSGSRDVWPVIIGTALIWAASHLTAQSDFLFMGELFVGGLLLGWLRWISGSTILTIVLHGLINCDAHSKPS